MPMRKSLILLLLFTCLIFCSCNPKKENEVVGTYLFEDSQEKDVIVLKVNHSYTRTLFVKETNQSSLELGTWKYENIGGPHISLERNDPKDATKQIGDSKPIENWFGRMYLGMDEDGARLYRKID